MKVERHEGGIIHLSGGWVGECTECKAIHWVFSGWVLFWPNGTLKGWAGYSGEWCLHGCRSTSGPLTTVDPLPFKLQHPYMAAYELGGEDAILVMVDGTATQQPQSPGANTRQRSRRGRTSDARKA